MSKDILTEQLVSKDKNTDHRWIRLQYATWAWSRDNKHQVTAQKGSFGASHVSI